MAVIFVFTMIFAFKIAPAWSDVTDGLVAYYSFEGNAKDMSSNGNDGTEHGGITYVNRISGKAARFDGIDEYIY